MKLPQKETSPKTKRAYRLNLFQKWLLFLGLFILIIMTLPVLLVIFIGLLPTLTILLTNSKNTYKLTIVGCFNLAGVLLCSGNLLNQFNFEEALFIISNVFNLIIMLGSAAIGVILYYQVPSLFVYIFHKTQHRRLKYIEKRIEKLSADWGSDIVKPSAPK